jgi:hypothetical protein
MSRGPAILGLCALLALGGCQQQVAGKSMPTSVVDTLPLGLGLVQEISENLELEREVDTDQPTPDTYMSDGPCHEMADQRIAYGENWTAFRSVADGVELDVVFEPAPLAVVVQHIVGYPDESAARAVFDRRLGDVAACAALDLPGLGGDVERLDGSTALWNAGGMVTVFAIKSNVLVDASVVELPDAERVATEVSRAILDRIA